MPQGSAASCLRRPPPPSCHQAAVQGAGPYEATSIYSPSGLPPAASPALSGLLRPPPTRGAGSQTAGARGTLLQPVSCSKGARASSPSARLGAGRWRLAQGRAFVSCTPVCISLGGCHGTVWGLQRSPLATWIPVGVFSHNPTPVSPSLAPGLGIPPTPPFFQPREKNLLAWIPAPLRWQRAPAAGKHCFGLQD